jgi:sugar O-acyltransferase (sialic acid O-acetyltransferase NeuD family)
VIVIGTGGHALEIYDILSKESLNNLYFFDVYNNRNISTLFGIPVISDENKLTELIEKDSNFILGIGNSKLRKSICEKVEILGGIPVSVFSSTAQIGKFNILFGPGCNIMSFTLVSSNVKVGKGTLVNSRVNIHHDVSIGEFCEIGPSALLLGNVKVGNNVMIGAGAIILPGLVIEDNVIIGAGAVVTKNVTAGTMVKGIPARNDCK